jgi:uncharacterized protein (DUF885 family)
LRREQASPLAPHESPATDETARFRAYLDDDWKQWLSEAPETATAVGVRGFDDRWSDDSPTGVETRRRHLARSLEELRSIRPEALPSSGRLEFDLYRDLLENADFGLRFGDDPFPYQFGMPRNLWMPLTQMDGIQTSAADILDLQPRETVRDYEDILRRLEGLSVAVEQNLALLEAGLAKGYSPPRYSIRGVTDQVAGLVPDDPRSSALLKPFSDFPARVGEAERARLVADARRTYTDRVAPAFAKLHRYLTERYLPACRESVGASALPDGRALYAYRVRWQTTTDQTPEEIHEVGLREVARIRAAMQAIIERTGFTGSFVEFLRFLKADPRFYYTRAEDLLDGYRVIAKRADPGLARLFGRLPRLPYGVIAVPEYRAPSSPAAYYIGGAPATGRPGYFYANTHAVGSRPRWQMEALVLHEAVPGHHLQIALAEELSELPDYRRHSSPTAFVEGWGLYAESLGEELGFYEDPYSKFGQLSLEMWRAIRLVVDTGLHAKGWSREQAIDLFRQYTGMTELEVGVEVDRYIVWPGQALAYKIGQLKFRELRAFAEARLGERFDVRAFHDVVLAHGALPLRLLEQRTRAWVEARDRDGAERDLAPSAPS